jgi:hypothetical protein
VEGRRKALVKVVVRVKRRARRMEKKGGAVSDGGVAMAYVCEERGETVDRRGM